MFVISSFLLSAGVPGRMWFRVKQSTLRHFSLCNIHYTHAYQSWARTLITFDSKQTQKKEMVLVSRTTVKEETAGALGERKLKNSTQSSSHGTWAATSPLSLASAQTWLKLASNLGVFAARDGVKRCASFQVWEGSSVGCVDVQTWRQRSNIIT